MGTLVSEVFRFVQFRSTNNNALASTGGGGVAPSAPKSLSFDYSEYDPLEQETLDSSAYKMIRDVVASSDTDKREQINSIAKSFKETNTANFWNGLSDGESSIIDFANWVASGNGVLDKTTLDEKLADITGQNLEDWNTAFGTSGFLTTKFTAWNLFLSEIVVKESDFTLYQLNQFLRGIQIIKSVGEAEILPETEEKLYAFLSPDTILPEKIFPLPRYVRLQTGVSEVENPAEENEDNQACEMIVKHGQSGVDLLEKFIAFIRSSQAEKQRLAMADFVVTYDENGNSTNGNEMPKTNESTLTIDLLIEHLPKFPSLYAEMINCDSVIGRFLKTLKFETPENEETNDLEKIREALEGQSYVTFPMSYEYFEEQLKVLKITLQKRINDYYKGQENVYIQTGTSIVKIEREPKKSASRKSSETETNETQNNNENNANGPMMLIQGDTNPITLVNWLNDDESLDAMIKVGDFMKVEQSISCYEAGEIAHIENVMIGEIRSKKTRRLEREERITESETIKEEEEERDLQTAERFEMSREAEKVMSQDMNFDVSLSASGKVGPMQITASTGFGFSQSTNQTQKSAQQYAQSVVERARNRTYSKVRNYEKLTILREFEDTNLHEFKNEQSELNPTPQNNVGIYRWVDKVYKNKLINYGRRLMIEMYIPDPAAMHRFLTQNQPIDSATEPLPPSVDANGINETNYVGLCSKYGVDGVEWPKATIIKSEVFTYNPSEKSTEKTWGTDAEKKVKYAFPTFDYSQGDAKLILIDDGYESTNVTIKIGGSMLKDGTSNGTVSVMVAGDAIYTLNAANAATGNSSTALVGHVGVVPVAINTWGVVTYNVTVIVKCKLTTNAENAFKLDLYNKIMQAYERKKAEFDRKLNAMKQSANKQYGNNPGTNRVIEQREIKRSFIELFNNNSSYFNQFVSHYKNNQLGYPDLDTIRQWGDQSYQAPKFFEDAFEWELMNYSFLPYFWNGRDYKNESRWGQNNALSQNTLADSRWTNVYNAQDTDPIFLSFLQAGYAKVVVPITPGSEAAVLNYLQTENIALKLPLKPSNKVLVKAWDEVFSSKVAVPAIDKPIQVGKDWESRVPTSLVILQTSAEGVPGTGLPCWRSDPTTVQGRFGDLIQINPTRYTP